MSLYNRQTQALNPCRQRGSALLHLPAAQILGLPGPPDPWGLHLKSLQIISLIRSAFDGNVTFVFSYIEIGGVF